MENIDSVVLNFDASSVQLMNVALAFIMLGIALDLSIDKFKLVFQHPKALITGLFAQLLLLPLLTFILIWVMQPQPSLALGMMLVASCPGGNISNFISSLSRANVALSIAMTTISSLAAVVFTPINFALYGNMYEPTQLILREISLDWFSVVRTIFMIIIMPIIVGLLFKRIYPKLAVKMARKFEVLSMMLFMAIVLVVLFSNLDYFIQCISAVFLLVLLHNGTALFTGYMSGVVAQLDWAERKSLIIETGIQNSGLGLIIIFNFFDGLGGMAIITAWWGIWHMISGFTIANLLRRV